jgi:hypothetical protein
MSLLVELETVLSRVTGNMALHRACTLRTYVDSLPNGGCSRAAVTRTLPSLLRGSWPTPTGCGRATRAQFASANTYEAPEVKWAHESLALRSSA